MPVFVGGEVLYRLMQRNCNSLYRLMRTVRRHTYPFELTSNVSRNIMRKLESTYITRYYIKCVPRRRSLFIAGQICNVWHPYLLATVVAPSDGARPPPPPPPSKAVTVCNKLLPAFSTKHSKIFIIKSNSLRKLKFWFNFYYSFHQNAQRILAVEFKRQLNKSEESLDCTSEITWSVKEGHEDTIVESDISSNSASDSDSDTISQSVKTEDSTSSESVQLPPNMAAWIPPVPIIEDSFIAIPTYIDHDCFVYLHPKKACKFQHIYFWIILYLVFVN